jgi:hypothetical protein
MDDDCKSCTPKQCDQVLRRRWFVELRISLCVPSSSIDETTPTHPPQRRSHSLPVDEEREVPGSPSGLRPGISVNKDFKTISSRSAAGAETEAVYGGTGLGLPITAKLVQSLAASFPLVVKGSGLSFLLSLRNSG